MFKKFLFSNGRKMPDFSITIAFFIVFTTSEAVFHAAWNEHILGRLR
jgi:hypothetical protein